MKKFFMLVVTIAVVCVVGTTVLAHKDIPAPSQKVEKVLSNERFLK